MTVYKHYEKELLHIHIPKTGGTSVTAAVESYGGLSSFLKKRAVPQCGNVPPQHMDIVHTRKFFPKKTIPSFAVIRDPWQRTVSEYVWQFNTTDWQGLDKWVKYAFRKVVHYKMLNHFLPQYKFIDDDVKLFRYEDFNTMIKYVGEQLGFEKFECNHKEQVSKIYTTPSIDVLDKEAMAVWNNLYQKDIELHQSL